MGLEIKILNSRIDLFNDETVELSKTAKEFRELTATKASFTQSFTVPATPFNNALFGLYYKGEVVGSFDYRVKHDASIFNKGTLVAHGSIELEGAEIKGGNPHSYTLTFFGKGVKEADSMDDVTLKQLDFSHLNHYYTTANVLIGATGGAGGTQLINNVDSVPIQRTDLIYPLLTSTQKLYYNSAAGDHFFDNMAIHAGHSIGQYHGVHLEGLKPAVSFPAIIDAINANLDTPSVSSPLFTERRFSELYMWLNPTEGKLFGDNTRLPREKFIGQAGTWPLWDFGNAWFIADRSATHTFNLSSAATVSGAPYYFIITQNGVELQRHLITTSTDSFTATLTEGATIEFYIEAVNAEAFVLTALDVDISVIGGGPSLSGNVLMQTVNYLVTVEPSDLISGMTVLEFLNGIVKMFNLTIEITGNGDLVLTPYNDWITEGDEVNIDRYLDRTSIKVSNTELFSVLDFKHTPLEVATNKAYNDFFGEEYGDLKASVSIRDKDSYEVQSPFSNLLFERTYDEDSTSGKGKFNFNTGAVLTLDENGEKSGVSDAPVIFYASPDPVSISSEAGLESISFVSIDKTSESAESRVHVVNNSTYTGVPADIQQQFSINWGGSIDPLYETVIQNSLYRIGYEDYISSIYEETSRFYTVEIYLPVAIAGAMQMNDILTFNGRKYAIDQYSVELTTGKVKAKIRPYKAPSILAFTEGEPSI